jgi:lipoprotein-anchoring transpeptidase ErfK/SrfK
MPRSRPLLIAHLVVLLAATSACSADAKATAIPSGVRVAGVDVGGLSVTAAAERIEADFGRRLRSPIRVRAAGHRRVATTRFLRLRFDALRSARRAERAARSTADPASVDVRPWVTFSEARLRTFVRRVARPVTRRPRDARLRFSVTRVSIRPARVGFDIDRTALRRRIAAALSDPNAPRVLRAARRTISPEVRRREVLRRNRTIVTVHRRGFRLRVFKRLRQVASYRVAVGMPGHATPRGRFRVANKAVDPAWAAPDKPWAGAYRGEVIAGGAAANPLRARWLGIVDGVGIHGTSATWSLGRRASHGCIRMAVPAVKRVYRMVPVGARVLIK